MPYEESRELAIADGVAVRFGWSGRPIQRYAVVLLVLRDGEWQEARVYDNHQGKPSPAPLHAVGGQAGGGPVSPGPAERGDGRRHRALEGQLASHHPLLGPMTTTGNTPGLDAGFDLLGRMAVDDELRDRYPSSTLIIAADSPDLSAFVERAVAEKRPVAIVMPDGADVVWRPRDVTPLMGLVLLLGLWLVHRSEREKDRPTFVPRDWVAEFHRAPERELAGTVPSAS